MSKRSQDLSSSYNKSIFSISSNIIAKKDKNKIMFNSVNSLERIDDIVNDVAKSLSKIGKNTIILDFRFNSNKNDVKGITDIINKKVYLEDTYIQDEGIVKIMWGSQVKDAFTIIISELMPALISELENRFQYILFIAQSNDENSYAKFIARYCNSSIVLIEDENVKENELIKVISDIENSDCKVSGVAFVQN